MIKPNHYGSNTWNCFSYKLKRSVILYSDLEYELWIQLETNPLVETFCEQPLTITGVVDGKVCNSILDMWVKWKDGTEKYIEVKYQKDKEKINNFNTRISKQLRLQETWSKSENINYEILTEKEIRIQPLLSNLKIIVPYLIRFKEVSELDSHKIIKYIGNQTVTVKELLLENHFSDFYLSLFFQYYTGVISLDIDRQPINNLTKVWCNGET